MRSKATDSSRTTALQRLRHFKHFDSEHLDQVYEQSIPPAEKQLRILDDGFEAVSRLLSVAQAQMKDSSDGFNGTPVQDEKPKSGHLGLIVDEAHCEVRRIGERSEHNVADFTTGSAEWHTFLVAWKAGAEGTRKDHWSNGYPGEWSSQNCRSVKRRVNGKLYGLDVELQEKVPPKLVEKTAT